MLRRHRRLIIIAAAVVLIAVVAGGIGFVRSRLDHAGRQTDLFGAGPSASATSPSPSPSPSPPPGVGLKGPMNILISGVDTRTWVKDWQPHSDADMVLHVTADLKHAYLFSLPRDLVVRIPPYPKAGFGGEYTKLTHAMSYGSRVPGSTHPNSAQGFSLLASTISGYTGIPRFDAGAILTFGGLSALVNAVGGVDMYVDQYVASIHMRPDGKYRTPNPNAEHGFSGPQAVYAPGVRHFVGWQALDYARQRYIPGGDYARQRHQRQLINAIIAKAFSLNLVTDPLAVERIARALGSGLVWDGRGRPASDFAYVLSGIRGSITLVNLRGSGVYSGGGYIGEALDLTSRGFFAAVRQDTCAAYLQAHPDLVGR